MKKKTTILIVLLIAILFYLMLYFIVPKNINVITRMNMEFEEIEFTGLVLNKYKDKNNHNYPIIKIKPLKSLNSRKIYLIRERSGVYSSINVGDTIYKKKGSMNVYNIAGQDTILLRKAVFK